MTDIKLLDVTLRDGGYKTNFHFSPEIIKCILMRLDQSGVDYIEVGYRNGPFKLIPNMGQVGMCPRDYLEYCSKWIRNAKLTVIFHPKNIQQYDLEEMKGCGVKSVRVCFPIQNPVLGFKSIEMAKQNSLEVFVNITRVSQYTREQIGEWVLELAKYDIKAIYLADSNGGLTPQKIENLFSYLKDKCSIPFGFHAHDNLFLAQANAVAAIKWGVQFVDASLFGFGKGAGNLRMEALVSFLHSEGVSRYDLCALLDAASYMESKFYNVRSFLSWKDVVLGLFNLSQDDAENLGEFSNINDYYFRAKLYNKNKILSRIDML